MTATPRSTARDRSVRSAADAARDARLRATELIGMADTRRGHRLHSVRVLRWSVVSVALLGAALVYAGHLWHGIALWCTALLVWQGWQVLSLWRSFGMSQRLRSARSRQRDAPAVPARSVSKPDVVPDRLHAPQPPAELFGRRTFGRTLDHGDL